MQLGRLTEEAIIAEDRLCWGHNNHYSPQPPNTMPANTALKWLMVFVAHAEERQTFAVNDFAVHTAVSRGDILQKCFVMVAATASNTLVFTL